MFHILLHKNRTASYVLTIGDASSVEISLATGDVVILHIGRNGRTPDLAVRSDEAAAGGSQISFTAGTGDCIATMRADDTTDLAVGTYDAEILVIDSSDGDEPKTASLGCVTIVDTQTADTSS